MITYYLVLILILQGGHQQVCGQWGGDGGMKQADLSLLRILERVEPVQSELWRRNQEAGEGLSGGLQL